MVKKEEEMRKDELENKSLEDLFSEAQETLEEAQARRAEEEASFSKVKYFTMDKERTYRIRILPLPPTSPRRGYEYPLHEYMMKIKNPANGKIRYINACRATEAGLSVDLIDTYRKLALKEVKGDKDMEDKIKGGSFGGGLGIDYKHAMYIYDLDNRDDGMLLWKASNGQFKALEEEITYVKKALLIWCDTCSLGKIYGYFSVFLIVEFCFFFGLVSGPGHHLVFVTVELRNEIVQFSEFFIDTGRRFSILFTKRLINIYVFIIFTACNSDIHEKKNASFFFLL